MKKRNSFKKLELSKNVKKEDEIFLVESEGEEDSENTEIEYDDVDILAIASSNQNLFKEVEQKKKENDLLIKEKIELTSQIMFLKEKNETLGKRIYVLEDKINSLLNNYNEKI